MAGGTENFDELMAAMEADELADQSKIAPRDYGKLRGISPQLVYYHIREGHLEKERCICGRTVIDIKAADEYFKKGEFDETGRTGEALAGESEEEG